jgi:hypothetical protein
MNVSIQDALSSINESLDELNAGIEVSAEVSIPVKLKNGENELSVNIDFIIEESGWEVKNPEEQKKKIEREIRNARQSQ